MSRACLSPYTMQSPDFPGQDGPVFTDDQKIRQVVVTTPCGSPPELPCLNAKLLHEVLECPDGSCDTRWYECPSEFGRQYTLLITGCNVIITSFENGLLYENGCDAQTFGAESFCFGKAYSGLSMEIYDSGNPCSTSFEFDGRIF